jgi:hypothetical protein
MEVSVAAEPDEHCAYGGYHLVELDNLRQL